MSDQDKQFMRRALELARKAELQGEVPVGAVLVADNRIIGEGWNQPITQHDPSAHAEVMALRSAGQNQENYRLPETTLYVTLEPCPMCAGAIIHARVEKVVFAAKDPRTGAAGSVFDLLPSDERFNHYTRVESGLLADESSTLLKAFFRKKRQNRSD
ncbi:MAG: tRNA adenosine(34) deaminase TadA [Gammaproteobacteria bacterium]|nr:tRNA adenosine(34) deaminase TadA [Gammaproteobacteria bacterium]